MTDIAKPDIKFTLHLNRDELASIIGALTKRAEEVEAEMLHDYYHTVAVDGRQCRELVSRIEWMLT